MTPLPGTDPTRDEVAARFLEYIAGEPGSARPLRHTTVEVEHLRRPNDVVILTNLDGGMQLPTTLGFLDVADLLRDVAEKLETGDHS